MTNIFISIQYFISDLFEIRVGRETNRLTAFNTVLMEGCNYFIRMNKST